MSITVKLNLSNPEVNRLFTRTLPGSMLFYASVMHKITVLLERSRAGQAYALLTLQQMEKDVQALTAWCFDEIDKFEGALEKKKHVSGKTFTFIPRFHPEANFDSRLASDLVELFEVYDRLISTLKLLRAARCFGDEDDYFVVVRRCFKAMNRLLSRIHLTKINAIPEVTCADVIDHSERYEQARATHGDVDIMLLYEAMTSNPAPKLEESTRISLQKRLKAPMENSTVLDETRLRGAGA